MFNPTIIIQSIFYSGIYLCIAFFLLIFVWMFVMFVGDKIEAWRKGDSDVHGSGKGIEENKNTEEEKK